MISPSSTPLISGAEATRDFFEGTIIEKQVAELHVSQQSQAQKEGL